jgi:DNA-binding HxlR family transcriptional regulator
MKSYHQYCPIAAALDLVGERWSLLIVRELLQHGQLRYSDLHRSLTGCGTNILASRLKDLEQGGVVTRRKLPPPAASTVYELTEYGKGLAPVLRELAHWGARVMGPPAPDVELAEGWLQDALHIAMPPTATSIEFRIDDEIASLVDGEVVSGPAARPDVVVSGDARGFYDLVVERDVDAVEVRGSRTALRAFLDTLPPTVAGPKEVADATEPVPA